MLASYLRNFIFVKTQKTGSTTVEVIFADFCGPEDIVTPLGKNDEMSRSDGKPICRNFEETPELDRNWINALVNDNPSYRQAARKTMKFYSHMDAREIKSKLDPAFWSRAFKFTTERHPYEKVVSKAFYWLGNRDMHLFPEMVRKILKRENYSTMQYYSIDGEPVVDDIVKLENLRVDLERVAEKIGVRLPDELPRMKSKTRRDPRPARDILTQAQKDEIYRVCKAEFELLDYER